MQQRQEMHRELYETYLGTCRRLRPFDDRRVLLRMSNAAVEVLYLEITESIVVPRPWSVRVAYAASFWLSFIVSQSLSKSVTNFLVVLNHEAASISEAIVLFIYDSWSAEYRAGKLLLFKSMFLEDRD